MIRWKLGLAAVVALVGVASVASAGTIALKADVQATYDPTTGAKTADTYTNDGQPHIYRVAIMANTTNLGAGEAFGLVGYDVGITGGLTRNTVSVGGATTGLTNPKPNYVGDSPTTALFVSSTGNPLTNWYTGGQNGDLGSSTTDLLGMLTAVDSANLDGLEDDQGVHATDPRLSIGTSAAGTRLGVVYVKWNGTTDSFFNINNPLYSIASVPNHSFSNTVAAVANGFHFIPVPEPTSIVLMGLAGLGTVMLARRRRLA